MLMNLLFSLIGNQLPRTASSDLQKALLLIENLQAGDFLSFENTLYFPETIDNCKISPVLNFDRHEQKKGIGHVTTTDTKGFVKGYTQRCQITIEFQIRFVYLTSIFYLQFTN